MIDGNERRKIMLGFRAWVPSKDFLQVPVLNSIVANYTWTGPVAEVADADSNLLVSDESYGVEESSFWGLFGYKDLDTLLRSVDYEENGGLLIGAIWHYGTSFIHTKGVRSRYAQVLALCNLIPCEAGSYCDFSPATYIVGSGLNTFGYFVCDKHSKDVNIITSREHQTVSSYMFGLSKRYGCSIVSLDQLKDLEEEYV